MLTIWSTMQMVDQAAWKRSAAYNKLRSRPYGQVGEFAKVVGSDRQHNRSFFKTKSTPQKGVLNCFIRPFHKGLCLYHNNLTLYDTSWATKTKESNKKGEWDRVDNGKKVCYTNIIDFFVV